MALQQIIQHQTGAYSQYWRVSKTDLNYVQKIASITLIGYVSSEARDQTMTPLDEREISASGANFDLWFSPSAIDPNEINQVKNSYLYVKSIIGGEFFSSVDV